MGRGGGIHCFDGYATIRCNILTGNSADLYGGGIFSGECSPTIRNNTIVNNSSYSYGDYLGGGIYSWHGSPIVMDCIIWNNGDDIYGCRATYCCIEDDDRDRGNIHEAPMFTAGPHGEFYLDPSSQCIDAGSRSAVEAAISNLTTQASGTPDTGQVDMGYHYAIDKEQRDTEISCSLNMDDLRATELLQGSMSVENRSSTTAVDIFAVIITPAAAAFSVTQHGLEAGVWPWLSDVTLPPGFAAGPVTVFELSVPVCVEQGDYTYLGAICRSGMGASGVLSSDQRAFTIGPEEKIEMLPIPAGAFSMGSRIEEEGRDDDEGPRRTVRVSAFRMSKTEVTQELWLEVMGWSDCCFTGENLPVENVTWLDCISFCKRLSEAQGYTSPYSISRQSYDGDHLVSARVLCDFAANGYRLPNEAEWEFGCRSGAATRYSSGDSESDLVQVGWYEGNSDLAVHPVAEKQPNAWGLCDMHGNVNEWCWDLYFDEYYRTRPDPDSDPKGASDGNERILRGGSWDAAADCCRSADREKNDEGHYSCSVGFRIARSINRR